jgi:hypothetical protein
LKKIIDSRSLVRWHFRNSPVALRPDDLCEPSLALQSLAMTAVLPDCVLENFGAGASPVCFSCTTAFAAATQISLVI